MAPEEAAPRCPMCEASDHRQLMRSRSGYPILRCRECSLVFTDSRGAPPTLELYPAFDQSQGVAAKGIRSAIGLFLRKRAGFVRSVTPSGRLLDYGCGSGAFACFMAGLGFEVVGLEPFSLGAPQSHPGLELWREPLESAAPRLGKFDVITLWQVLEHVPRPVALLVRLAALLAPGGAIVVSVPNFASWQSALFRGRWFHLDPPRHLSHFEAQTLRTCVERSGLEVVSEERLLLEYGTTGWVQSGLDAVLPHPSFLYEVAKDRGALREMGFPQQAVHLVASVAGAVPLFALSVPLEVLASRFNRAAVLTVAARPA